MGEGGVEGVGWVVVAKSGTPPPLTLLREAEGQLGMGGLGRRSPPSHGPVFTGNFTDRGQQDWILNPA